MTKAIEVTDEQLEAGIPRPSGYKILISLPTIKDTYDSGIVKAESTRRNEEVSTIIASVLELGPDAYQDKVKFPSGPWCKVGDYIIIRAYSGTRFTLYGKEFRLLNDDSVEGVVADPTGYSRV